MFRSVSELATICTARMKVRKNAMPESPAGYFAVMALAAFLDKHTQAAYSMEDWMNQILL
jgi:hypothetical protein